MTGKWGPWHLVLCALPVVAVTAAYLLFDPLPQSLAYHDFADRRAWLGIPNFADVSSNLAFLLVGVLGLRHCLLRRPAGARLAWTVFFSGVVLIAFGSAYYHWAPGNGTLVWDRAAMMVAFMALFVALWSEHVDARLERNLLVPALVTGIGMVLYWHAFDDLRLYFVLQGVVFSSALLLAAGFESPFRQKRAVFTALGLYAAAIALEQLDRPVFALTGGTVSGHTLKHGVAALASYWIYRMLRGRPEAA